MIVLKFQPCQFIERNEGYLGMTHDGITSFENLFAKYQASLTENGNLKEEIRIIEALKE